MVKLCVFFVNTGEVISERDRCTQCKGKKITQEKKVLEVNVEKGMQHGQKIVFDGEADEAVRVLCNANILLSFCNSLILLNWASKVLSQYLQNKNGSSSI